MRTPTPPTYRLRLPGPTEVPERVRQALARPVLNHRGPEFRAEMAQTEALIRPLIGTGNAVLFFAATGTGMMEAALANVLAPGDRMLAVVHGQFGERFAAIGRSLGAQVELLEFAWGDPIDADALEARLAQADYRAVTVIHNESSTGVTADLPAIGRVVARSPALLIVDSVSGLGGIEMRQDEWEVDVLVSASQKALMCPPGLGLASVSAKAWRTIRRAGHRAGFYWSFERAGVAAEKHETAFTAPVSLVIALRTALEMIHEEGVPSVLARHGRLAAALRAGAAELGLPTFGRGDHLSPTVVVLSVPESLDGAAIVRGMYEQFTAVIAGARNRLAGRVVRLGTMGWITEATILTDVYQLGAVLAGLGWKTHAGAGLARASARLSQ